MVDLKQNLLDRFQHRFAERPLEDGLDAQVQPLDSGRALIRIEDAGRPAFEAVAAVLTVPYPSGLQRLLALDPHVRVVLVDELSAGVYRAAAEAGVGVVDLRGRGRLRGPGFAYVVPPVGPRMMRGGGVDVEEDDAKPQRRPSIGARGGSRVSPFAAKASRIPRALLSDLQRVWRVSDLAEVCRMNPGNAHRVVGALVERDFVRREDEAYAVDDAGSLLEAWCEEGVRPRAQDRISLAVGSDVVGRVREVLNGLPSAVVSGELAAELYAPHLPSASAVIHCLDRAAWDPERLEDLGGVPALRPQGSIIIDLVDEGAGDFHEERLGLPVASPQQVYFDLYRERFRSRGAADHLRREVLGY